MDDKLRRAVEAARRELDQERPWIPGAVFLMDERLKPALLEALKKIAGQP